MALRSSRAFLREILRNTGIFTNAGLARGGRLGSRVVSHCRRYGRGLSCWTQAQKGLGSNRSWATLSGNSLRQTVHTHRASVHQVAKLVVALLRVARVTDGLVESNGSLPTSDKFSILCQVCVCMGHLLVRVYSFLGVLSIFLNH